jgi:hypothetical protein
MIFNYKKYPSLEYILTGRNPMMSISIPSDRTEQDRARASMEIFNILKKVGTKTFAKIEYISDPFHAAMGSAASKLNDLFTTAEVVAICNDKRGVFIMRDLVVVYNFYSLIERDGILHYEILCTRGDVHVLHSFGTINGNTGIVETDSVEITQEYVDKGVETLSYICAIFFFKKHVDIDQKVLEYNQKVLVNKDRMKNELKAKVTILDSTYFTEIISKGGFDVRGHWRMQPVGEGRTERKLTWINPFEKTGYKRKAKK